MIFAAETSNNSCLGPLSHEFRRFQTEKLVRQTDDPSLCRWVSVLCRLLKQYFCFTLRQSIVDRDRIELNFLTMHWNHAYKVLVNTD